MHQTDEAYIAALATPGYSNERNVPITAMVAAAQGKRALSKASCVDFHQCPTLTPFALHSAFPTNIAAGLTMRTAYRPRLNNVPADDVTFYLCHTDS